MGDFRLAWALPFRAGNFRLAWGLTVSVGTSVKNGGLTGRVRTSGQCGNFRSAQGSDHRNRQRCTTRLQSEEVCAEGLQPHEVAADDHGRAVVGAVVVRRRLPRGIVPLSVSEDGGNTDVET